jgi:membrane-associated phospholipid phosphatase
MTVAALTTGTAASPASASDGRKLLVVALATIIVLFIFNRIPEIDIAVSRAFFDPRRCDWAGPGVPCTFFPYYESKALEALRFGLQYLQLAVAVGLLVHLIVRYARGARLPSPGVASELAAFASYLICVGLIVNVILKVHWGRPRPFQIDAFNGEWPMVRAGEISSYCQANCSFVSGEAAGAFWLVCVAILLPERWRLAGVLVAVAIALLTTFLRVAFGMHFLSDVTMSALLIVLTFLATRLVLVKLARFIATRPKTDAVAPAE